MMLLQLKGGCKCFRTEAERVRDAFATSRLSEHESGYVPTGTYYVIKTDRVKIKLALQDDVSFLDYDYEVSISECAVGAEQLVEEEKLQLIAAFQSLYSLVTRIVGYHADRIEVVHYRRNKSRPVNGKREFITLTSSTERPQTPE